ncbi:endonuclease domain-containing protein [Xanthobacter autotrophicus]|uniref:endonuclease domain-containing protein n=1 Tax=Xanthobacter autotrophicus TaxID=280 RepID=UPI00372A8F92
MAREVATLAGLDRSQLIAASDALGAELGIRIALYPLAPQPSFTALIESLLDRLAQTLSGLWPAWFPGAADYDQASAIALAVIHGAADGQAAQLGVSTAWLRRAAGLAMAGLPPRTPELPEGGEIRNLCMAIAAASGAHRLVIVLDPQGEEADFAPWIEGLCRWIVNHADVSVWVAKPAARWRTLALFRSIGSEQPIADAGRDSAPDAGIADDNQPFFGGIMGRPNPNSLAEVALWRSLCQADWARGCSFNRIAPVALAPKVDILWEQEKLVVEIDGDDHRAKTKYAQDRERDFALLQAGFLVLRLTNEQVLSDLQLSLAKVKAILALRRDITVSPDTGDIVAARAEPA